MKLGNDAKTRARSNTAIEELSVNRESIDSIQNPEKHQTQFQYIDA
jgi:hypothetical protein